jgi:outer membrane protein
MEPGSRLKLYGYHENYDTDTLKKMDILCMELKCIILYYHYKLKLSTMKTLMISLSILCIFSVSINAEGPFNKGKWILAGTMPFGGSSDDREHLGGVNGAGIFFGSNWTSNGQTSEKDKFTSWAFTPMVGYFVIDNLAAGLSLNLRGQSDKDGDNSDQKTKYSTITVGPWVRYYLAQYPLLNDNVFVFGDVRANFGGWKQVYTSGSTSQTYKEGLTQFAIGPGIVFLPADCFSIDFLIQYNRVIWSDKDSSEPFKWHTSSFGFAFGLTFYFACGGGS